MKNLFRCTWMIFVAVFGVGAAFGHYLYGQPPNEVTDHTALLSGTYWSGFDTGPVSLPSGRPVFVTYSFPIVAPASHSAIMGPAFATFESLDSTQMQQVRDALEIWGDACGITFLEATAGQGQLNFATYEFTGSSYAGAGGIGFYPFGDWNIFTAPYYHDQQIFDSSGDVFLNREIFVGGLPNFGTLLHEVGHALGLKHPWEVVFGHDEVLRPDLDTVAYTIMSVNGVSATLAILDYDAVEFIYGTNLQDGTQVASWAWNSATSTLTQNGYATDDVVIGVGSNDIINANGGDDHVYSLNGNDQLRGGGGSDWLWGGAGNDLLRGGPGADVLYGGGDSDTAEYLTSSGVTVALDGSLVATGEAVGDLFDSIENIRGSKTHADQLRGNQLSNTLTGNDGNDTLEGAAGSDRLNGGMGNDALTGGTGADRFQFFSHTEGIDTITDFSSNDFIQIKGTGFGGISPGALPANRLVQGVASNQPFGQFLYDQATGILRFDADGTGPAQPIDLVLIGAGKTLTTADFSIF